MPHSDRRRTKDGDRRGGRRIAATFAVKKSVGVEVQLCLAEDIGPAGITVRRPLDAGHRPRTPVSLAFELPGIGHEIAARGVIVTDSTLGRWRRTGVRFIAVRPDHQQLIAAYCSRG